MAQIMMPFPDSDYVSDNDNDLLLMATPKIGPMEFGQQMSVASLLGPLFAKLLGCFSEERNYGQPTRWPSYLLRPFGKSHLLVHFLKICLTLRALYCIVAVAIAPSLSVVWLQATLLLISSLVSFHLLAILKRIATFDWAQEYHILDRFLQLKAAAHVNNFNGREFKRSKSIAIATFLVAFCLYIWSIATSSEMLFHAGYYHLLIRDESGDEHEYDNGTNQTTVKMDLLGGNAIFLLIVATSFANALLCGLAISTHLLIANSVLSTFSQFIRELAEKIVSRQISRPKQLEALMCQSDNLLRFVLFARLKFTRLGWATFFVVGCVNLSVMAIFCQFDVARLKDLMVFANKYTNNVLSSLLLLASGVLLASYIHTLKMDNRFNYIAKFLSLENSFPNEIQTDTQRLGQALLERLELANTQQKGLHRLQLLFSIQFFFAFALIGVINYEIEHIFGVIFSAMSSFTLLTTLWYKGGNLLKGCGGGEKPTV